MEHGLDFENVIDGVGCDDPNQHAEEPAQKNIDGQGRANRTLDTGGVILTPVGRNVFDGRVPNPVLSVPILPRIALTSIRMPYCDSPNL